MAETTAAGTAGPRIDPGNAEQARAWDGDEGEQWARNADRYDASMRAYQPLLIAAARIGTADRVLDVGCGTGQTTRDAARLAPEGRALGVDLSSPMLAVARERARAEGLANVTFEQGDAQVHPFPPGSYDLVVSRNGASFFADPAAAFANLARALRAGGRLTLLTWQPLARNEWLRALLGALAAGRDLPGPPQDRPGPFGLSTPERISEVLVPAGFADIALEPLEQPISFGTDADDARSFLLGQLGWLLEGLDPDRREQALSALSATLEQHSRSDGVAFGSAAWLVTARRA